MKLTIDLNPHLLTYLVGVMIEKESKNLEGVIVELLEALQHSDENPEA